MTDLDRIEGLFVGQLDERELRTFERAIADGEAYRSYEGVPDLWDAQQSACDASGRPRGSEGNMNEKQIKALVEALWEIRDSAKWAKDRSHDAAQKATLRLIERKASQALKAVGSTIDPRDPETI